MDVPSLSHPAWTEIVQGKRSVRFEYLAARIFLGQALVKVKRDPSQAVPCAEKLRSLLAENARLPKVQRDLKQITG